MSRRVTVAIAVLFLAALFAGAAPAQPKACETDNRELRRTCAIEAVMAHPAKTIGYWKPRFELPPEERAGVAPADLVQFLSLDAIAQGIPASPRMATDHPGVLQEIRAVLAGLPRPIRQGLSARFAGVYLLEDFGGTGFTDAVQDESGREVAAFVVLDPAVLARRTANEWATWKESSPFVEDGHFALRATLEDAAHDTRRQAIEYILLHELGHVLSVGGSFHPSWNGRHDSVPAGRYPFYDVSWSFDRSKGGSVNRFADALPEANRVRYYFGPNLAATEMAATYRHLEKTAFPTLYAATHFADDFAESFANYVHVAMLHKPFEIAILEDGKVVKRYGPCWEEPRCAAKRRILEDFLR